MLAGTHTLCTTISLTHDGFGGGTGSYDNCPKEEAEKRGYCEKPLSGQHQDDDSTTIMTEFVTNLYSGNGVMPLQNICLAKDVVFEASPVISVGREEVMEIYRAFYLFSPVFLSPPKCLTKRRLPDIPQGKAVILEWTYLLHLRYFGIWNDKSLLMVRAQYFPTIVKQENDNDANSPLEVVKLEERWNGVKSLDASLIALSRRINGKLSWYFTSTFVP